MIEKINMLNHSSSLISLSFEEYVVTTDWAHVFKEIGKYLSKRLQIVI